MNDVVELVRAFLELAIKAAELPEDWNDEKSVQTWLQGTNEPLAKLIVLITPDQVEALKASLKRRSLIKSGAMERKPTEFDWDQLIDWIAALLVGIFPQYETIIVMVATILKQLLDLITEQLAT